MAIAVLDVGLVSALTVCRLEEFPLRKLLDVSCLRLDPLMSPSWHLRLNRIHHDRLVSVANQAQPLREVHLAGGEFFH